MNLGMPEIIGLTILGLILFGPKKLPEMGRQLGRLMAEFKRASQEFQNQLQDEVRQLEMEDEVKKVKEAVQPIGTAAREVQGNLQTILTDSTSSTSEVQTQSTHNG